jgi:hypothetical protein
MEEPERHDPMLTAPAFGHELQVLTGMDGVLGAERRPREVSHRRRQVRLIRPARFPTLISYG